MNRLFTLIGGLALAIPAFAASDCINYQAVVYNNDGTPAANSNVGLKFEILNGSSTLFTESAQTTSDDRGMVSFEIGSTQQNGLSDINWAADGVMKLQVSIDPNGGTNYTNIYSSTLQSVPTALYAAKSGESAELNAKIDEVAKDILITNDILKSEINANLNVVMNLIEALEEKVNNLEMNVGGGDNNAAINELKTYVNNLMNDVASLKGQIAMLDEERRMHLDMINDLQMHVSNIETDSLNNRQLIEVNKVRIEDTMQYINVLSTSIDYLKTEIDILKSQIK